MIGILEAGIGLGLLFGPIIGALLYKVGGYSCPFWTVGFLFLTIIPILMKVLPQAEMQNQDGVQEPLFTEEQSRFITEMTDGALSTARNSNLPDGDEEDSNSKIASGSLASLTIQPIKVTFYNLS